MSLLLVIQVHVLLLALRRSLKLPTRISTGKPASASSLPSSSPISILVCRLVMLPFGLPATSLAVSHWHFLISSVGPVLFKDAVRCPACPVKEETSSAPVVAASTDLRKFPIQTLDFYLSS